MDKIILALVAEPDGVVREEVSRALREAGFAVSGLATGDGALEEIRAARPQLVLAAAALPGVSGLDLCRAIREDATLAGVMVVIIGQGESAKDPSRGVDDWIVWPARTQDLAHRARLWKRFIERDPLRRKGETRSGAVPSPEPSGREDDLRLVQTMLDTIPSPVFYKDAEGRYLGCNKAFEAFIGIPQAELIGKPVDDITPEKLAKAFERSERALLGKGAPQSHDTSLIYADGSRHDVSFSMASFQNAAGQRAGVVGVMVDTTEKRRTEDQFRLFADAVQSTRDMISITDEQNRFSFVNHAFLEAYGYRMEEVLGRTPGFLYSPENPPELYETVFEGTLSGGWRGEVLNVRKDGTQLPIYLSTSLIRTRAGKTLGLIGVARDISEEKQAARQAAAFAQLGARLSGALSPREAAHVILEIAADLFDWDHGSVHLHLAAEDKCIPVLKLETRDHQRVPVQEPASPIEPGPLMRRVMKEGAQFTDPEPGFGHGMCVPIRSRGATIGVLSVHGNRSHTYAGKDLALLQTVADYCGDAMKRIETETRYRSIFENATEGFFQTTPEGRYRSANPGLARMLGYNSPEELIASVTDIGRQMYVDPQRREEYKRVLEAEGAVNGFEFEHYRRDGSRIWVRLTAHVVRDKSGAVQLYEGSVRDVTERKLAEMELERTRNLQRALLDNMSNPAWLKDRAGCYLACNQPLARIFGVSPDRIIGRTVHDFWPEEGGRLSAEDQRVIESARPVKSETRLTRRGGTPAFFEVVKSPILNERGEVTGTVGIAHDITERKWTESVLEAQRDLATFLGSTNELKAAMDRLLEAMLRSEGIDAGVIYIVDPKTGQLELVAQEGLSGRFVERARRLSAKVTPPRASPVADPSAPVARIVRELRRDGLKCLLPVPIFHAGRVVAFLTAGSRRLVNVPALTCRSIGAIATHAGGAIARIWAEESLRSNQQLLEKTLQSLHAAVFLIEAESGVIMETNPAASRIFGHPREALVGVSCKMLHINPGAFQTFKDVVRHAFEKQGFLDEFQFEMKRRDGTAFPAEHTVIPVKNAAGEFQNWVSVVRDISKQKQTEKDLHELSQRIIEAQEGERQRVARDLHDGVNQLLASAKMRLMKVQEREALSPATREILARCGRLLVEALEENRRIAHNLRPSDLDVLGFASACRSFCKNVQSRTELEVRCHIGRDLPRLAQAVELNLFRILQEAVNNVIKHARAKSVKVHFSLKAGAVVLRIRDDGRGFNLPGPQASRGKAGGLGLSNIRERAVSLGGDYEIECAPGAGTTITVTIPVAGNADGKNR